MPGPIIERIYREFTPEESARYDEVLRLVESEKADIIARGREYKKCHEAGVAKLREASRALKAERERRGMSLADIESRCGIEESLLSQLESDTEYNPTVSTLVRYADALGKNLSIVLTDK